MKKQIIKLVNYIETKRQSNPRLYKILLISLCFLAPIEMASIKLGIWGYKKYKIHQFKKKVIEDI